MLKSSTQHSSVNEVFVLNISKEDVESQPNSPPQELINLDHNDQPMWEIALTLNSAIIQPDSYHDLNDSEKSLIELNNGVRNDLEHFKRCIRSMRNVYDKLFDRDDQSKTDLEKSITKFLDGQRVAKLNNGVRNDLEHFKRCIRSMRNVYDKLFDRDDQSKTDLEKSITKFLDGQRVANEWSKSKNVSSEQTDRTDPPPHQAHTEHVNAVFIRSGKSDESLKTKKDPLPPIIGNNKIPKDKPIKASKKGYHVVETKEYPFRNDDPPVPDLQSMEELCQPSLNGRGGPIAPIAIQATNFGPKNDMIQQVQNSYQFHGLPGDDANKHLDKFLHVIQSIKVNGVPDDALRLTFEQMAKMFLGKYFPPSMVTKLRNEITNFRQRPDESLFEAWERYKLSIDRCPNHNMLPVTQTNTFYNGLTLRHRDTINAAAGGTFMKRQIVALKDEMAKINKNLMRVLQVNQQVKAVTTNCETCGGPHSCNDCPAIVGQTQNVYVAGAYQGNSYQPQGNRNMLSYRSNNYLGPPWFNQDQNRNNQNQNFQNQNMNQGNIHPQGNNQGRNQFFQGASQGQNPPPAYQAPGYQASVHQPPIHQPQVVTTNEFTNYMKANDAILKNMQTNMTSLINSNLELKNMFGQFMKMNIASSSGSRTLPSNTITNPKEDLKGITTRSGNAYQGPTIPTTYSSLPKVVERETEVTKDTVPLTNNGSTKDVQSLVVQVEIPILNYELVIAPIIEPVVALVSAPKPNQKPLILYPSRLHDQKLHALILMPKFGPTIKTLLTNKDKLSDLARTPLSKHCSAVLLKKLLEKLRDPGKFLIPCDFLGMDVCLALADLGASINLMPLAMWNKLSLPELYPMCMTLELAGRLISRPVGVAENVFVKVGTFHFPADFIVIDFDADPRVPLILGRSFLKTGRALIDVFKGELTLRVGKEAITFNLDQTSRYSANYNDMTANRIDVIDMACEEYSKEVLGFSDVIASGNPTPYYDPIVSTSFPTLTSFRDSDFLLEEVDAFLALEDDPTSPEVDHSYFDTKGDIHLLEAFLNDDPSLPPPNQGNYLP
nr:hypothetical protein [Tanacetum cinerariifolium]